MQGAPLTDQNAAEQYQALTGADARHDVVLPLALGTVLEVHRYLLRLCSNGVKEEETGEAQLLRPLPEWTRWPARIVCERAPDPEHPASVVDQWLEPFRRPDMLRLIEVADTGGGSSSLDGRPRRGPTMDDLLAISDVAFGGLRPGTGDRTDWRLVGRAILGRGRPPNLGLHTFGIMARAVFEHRTTRAHRQANTAVGMLASVGKVEELFSRDVARRRWADRFRKFDGHLVGLAVNSLVGTLRESGVFEHGAYLPKVPEGEE